MNIRQSEFLLHSFRCQTAVKNLAWLRGTVMKNAFLYHREVQEGHIKINKYV